MRDVLSVGRQATLTEGGSIGEEEWKMMICWDAEISRLVPLWRGRQRRGSIENVKGLWVGRTRAAAMGSPFQLYHLGCRLRGKRSETQLGWVRCARQGVNILYIVSVAPTVGASMRRSWPWRLYVLCTLSESITAWSQSARV